MDKGYAEIFYFGYKKVVFAAPGGVPARPRHSESTYRTCHRHLLPDIWPTKKGLLHQQSIASAAGPLKYVLNYILSQHLS